MATPREQLAEVLKQSRLDAGFESHGALAKRLNCPARLCPRQRTRRILCRLTRSWRRGLVLPA
jgi:hypothetical protein